MQHWERNIRTRDWGLHTPNPKLDEALFAGGAWSAGGRAGSEKKLLPPPGRCTGNVHTAPESLGLGTHDDGQLCVHPEVRGSAACFRAKSVVVLGSTGSIGRSALDVITASGGALRARALTAWRSAELLGQQARLSAIVGRAGLSGTWAALQAGKTVALASKESLVVGGPLIVQLAARTNAQLLPVDSEHSAIFQALQAGRRHELKRVILTASGGPFRHHTPAQLAQVTVRDALAHPTWNMGQKITIDSATMMNKALEIIEARWLFNLSPDQIAVTIHPQSIVHSMVEYVDGAVIAQLSPPDMRLPIQYALYWPERRPGPTARFDWTQSPQFEFHPPDLDRFDALRLGFEVASMGGSGGAVLNAANEAAVAAFLAGELGFHQIVPLCRIVLEHHTLEAFPSLEQIERLDAWARGEVAGWLSRRKRSVPSGRRRHAHE